MKSSKKSAREDQSSNSNTALSTDNDRRLSESVYDALLKMILSGDLQPGQPVSELELTRLLNVSRTPIHEAVGQLIKDGLVIQPPNRRPFVSNFSADDIFDIYEMRRILESEAAYKAASRIDRQSLARLRQRAEDFQSQANTSAALDLWTEFDDDFHSTIAAASGSRRLEADIVRYRRLHQVFKRVRADYTVIAYGLQEHLMILEALENRDGDLARQRMHSHIEEWQRYFMRQVSDHLKPR